MLPTSAGVVAGAAFIVSGTRLPLGNAVAALGWVLVGTSLVLAIVPWRLHQRFAAWSVPQALRYLPIIGVASLAGGLGLVSAVVFSHAAAYRAPDAWHRALPLTRSIARLQATPSPICKRRSPVQDGSKKFSLGMVLGLVVGMLVYRLILG